jgi:hypothetical protein
MRLPRGDITMWKKLLLLAALGMTAAVLPGSQAHAQATRTWVSGVGDDANPCSRTAPCKTWAGAISKTSPGGEIDALDPGGFGGLTITKSITLDGGGGQVASVLVAGTNGITVAAGSTDVVMLRNLRFQGLLGNGSNSSNAGLSGISFVSGSVLTVDKCAIYGFNASGISATTSGTSQLYVSNTYITNAPTGISLAATGQLTGVITNTQIFNISSSGIASSGSGSPNFAITNSLISSNLTTGTGILAGTSGTRLNVDASSVSYNSIAFKASVSGAIIRASNNDVYDNGTNFSISGGSILSTGNNRLVTDGTAPTGSINQQ